MTGTSVVVVKCLLIKLTAGPGGAYISAFVLPIFCLMGVVHCGLLKPRQRIRKCFIQNKYYNGIINAAYRDRW